MTRGACFCLLLVSSVLGCGNQAVSAVVPKAEVAPSRQQTANDATTSSDSEYVGCTSQFCAGEPALSSALVAWDGESEFQGGARIQVNSGAELQAAIARQQMNSEPLTIVVQNTISPDNSPNLAWIDVRDVTNISIVGAGAGVEFDRIGIRLTRASNIVLRRLHVPLVQIGEEDGISLEGHVDHAWIDHSDSAEEHEAVGKQYHGTVISPHDEGAPLFAEPDPARVTLPGRIRALGMQRFGGCWV